MILRISQQTGSRTAQTPLSCFAGAGARDRLPLIRRRSVPAVLRPYSASTLGGALGCPNSITDRVGRCQAGGVRSHGCHMFCVLQRRLADTVSLRALQVSACKVILRSQETRQRADGVCCTDQEDGSGVPLGGGHPGLLRFSRLSELSLCHAHRGSLGGFGSLCTWLPASLHVSAYRRSDLDPHPSPTPTPNPNPTNTPNALTFTLHVELMFTPSATAILILTLPRIWSNQSYFGAGRCRLICELACSQPFILLLRTSNSRRSLRFDNLQSSMNCRFSDTMLTLKRSGSARSSAPLDIPAHAA